MTDEKRKQLECELNEQKDKAMKIYELVDNLKCISKEMDDTCEAYKCVNHGRLSTLAFKEAYDKLCRDTEKAIADANMDIDDYGIMSEIMMQDEEVSSKYMALVCATWASVYKHRYPVESFMIMQNLYNVLLKM